MAGWMNGWICTLYLKYAVVEWMDSFQTLCGSVCFLCVHFQVDNMVKQNGVFYRKTAQEREIERRVKERKQQLMESYKTRQSEIVSPATVLDTKLRTSVDRGGEHVASSPLSGREERIKTITDVSNSLYSVPLAEKRSFSEEYYEKKVLSAASSRQNKGEGLSAEDLCLFTSVCYWLGCKQRKSTVTVFCSFATVEGAERSQITEVKSPELPTSTCESQTDSLCHQI